MWDVHERDTLATPGDLAVGRGQGTGTGAGADGEQRFDISTVQGEHFLQKAVLFLSFGQILSIAYTCSIQPLLQPWEIKRDGAELV